MKAYRKAVHSAITLTIFLTFSFAMATSALASLTYTYVGNPFTQYYGFENPSISYMKPYVTNIMLSFTVSAPLKDSASRQPVAWLEPGEVDPEGNIKWGYTIGYNSTGEPFHPMTIPEGALRIDVASKNNIITDWGIDFDWWCSGDGCHHVMLASTPRQDEYIAVTRTADYPTEHCDTTVALNRNAPGKWTVVPVPPSILLLGSGLIGLWGWRRKQLKAN